MHTVQHTCTFRIKQWLLGVSCISNAISGRELDVMLCCFISGEFSFMGSIILEAVVRQLVTEHGLFNAKRLIIAGSR